MSSLCVAKNVLLQGICVSKCNVFDKKQFKKMLNKNKTFWKYINVTNLHHAPLWEDAKEKEKNN